MFRLPFAYYGTYIGEYKDIFRFIITHPDMDHMTGLYRMHELEQHTDILNFWHTGFHDFNLADTTDQEWDSSPYDKRDWTTYKKLRRATPLLRACRSIRAPLATTGQMTALKSGLRRLNSSSSQWTETSRIS